MPDRNDLAYWFPKLRASGVLVPRTEIVTTDANLALLCDGLAPAGYVDFMDTLRAACRRIDFPCFLRTGQTSHKHDWSRSCFVRDALGLRQHVYNLVEFSEIADILGLPTCTWAVREFLALRHGFTAFNGMPVAVEFRTFIRDGEILCRHPYWPEASIASPSDPHWKTILAFQSSLIPRDTFKVDWLDASCSEVAKAFSGDGAWSIDFAQLVDGRWCAIDMAEMDRSFHWPGCPNDPHPEHHAPEPAVADDDFPSFLKRSD